jgi:hypothetical protein
MKSIVNRIVALLAIITLTGVLALGKTIEKEVTLRRSVSVNGTLVKKGTYKVTFNEETGELSFRKGRNVVATAQARLEKTTERDSFYTESPSGDAAAPPVLVNVSLKDGNLATIVNSTAARQ